MQIVDSQNKEPLKKISEYDVDNVHYIMYDDGSITSSTSLGRHSSSLDIKWKSKNDYIKNMNLFNKILYYLWIIVLYKKLPESVLKLPINIDCYMTEDPFPQTCQRNEYSSYWHWNYWNPLTYIVFTLFVIFMCIATIGISIMKILKMSNLITIKIDNA